MSDVSPLPSIDERKNKRRLHLREISQNPEAAAESIGGTLRAARVERGEEADAAAAKLKMRREQLDAIEEDDFSRLPGRTYAIGFIRSYARHLGLDADALIQRFKDDENADQELGKPVELVFPEAPEEKHVPNGSILILALVIAMVIYGISYVTMPNRKAPTAAKAEVPAVAVTEPAPPALAIRTLAPAPITAILAETPVPVTPVASPPAFVAGRTGLPSPALPSIIVPADAAADDAAHGNLESTALFLPASTLPVSNLVVARTSMLSAAADPQGLTPSPPPDAQAPAPRSADARTTSEKANTGSRITLKALEPTYVRIKDPQRPDGKGILIDRVLKAGESFQAPDRAGLVMQTGNAGGLQVEVDGRSIGVLGKSGEVITRIPVDPSYFLERTAASQ